MTGTFPVHDRTPVQYLYMSLIEGISPMTSIDLQKVQIRSESAGPNSSSRISRPPHPKHREKFLRGPIPLNWLSRAAMLPGRSLHVAIAVWFMSGLKKTRIVPISNITALQFGLDRNAKYRGLEWLEDAELISVERRAGRAPIVTILESPGEK